MHWNIHNAFHVSLLKPFKVEPPMEPNKEEQPLEFDEKEEILKPKYIVKHEDKLLQSGKVLQRYLVKFLHCPEGDTRWMQEPQLDSSLSLLQEYKAMYKLDS